jgi:hypothetical protein
MIEKYSNMVSRGIMLLCLATVIAATYPAGWSDDILISSDTAHIHFYPAVDVDRNNQVWACWEYVVSSMHCEIFYTKRDSLGNCLIPETNLSNNLTNSIVPRVLVDTTDNVHFVWRDDSPLGYGVWYAKLANDGSILVPPHLAISGAGGSSSRFEMVLNKNHELNIAWGEAPSGYDQVIYSRLDSIGNPLISRIRVSPAGFDAYYPGIGIDSFGNFHFGYRNDTTGTPYRFMYTKLDQNGNVLIPQKVFGSGSGPTFIADRSQNIHLVWGDYAWQIQYIKLNQAGNILVGPKQLTSYLHNGDPHMAMDSLYYLHVVWDLQGDSMGIMYAKLDTMGNFVIPPTKLVYPPPFGYVSLFPRIAVDRSNRLHLVWQDQRLNHTAVFYKRGENDIIGIETSSDKYHGSENIAAFPNPFQNDLDIIWRSKDKYPSMKVTIFDVSGRRIKEFNPDDKSVTIHWNGHDENGKTLPAGIYFIEAHDLKRNIIKSIIKIK